MINLTEELLQNIDEDIDVLIGRLSQATLIEKSNCVEELLQLVTDSSRQISHRTKIAVTLSFLLSECFPYVSESAALDWITGLVYHCRSATNNELKSRIIGICLQLSSRVGLPLAVLEDDVKQVLVEIQVNTQAGQNREEIGLLIDRINRATKVFSVRKSAHRQFAVEALDLSQASRNLQIEKAGDWYQDPWGWPEIEWLATHSADDVKEVARSARCGWTVPLDVAKQKGGVRSAIVINPMDRLVYQSLVDKLSASVSFGMPGWVFGWRLDRSNPIKGEYLDNGGEWQNFRERVYNASKLYDHVAQLDVRSFFSTANTDLLLTIIGRRFKDTSLLNRLDSYFQSWNERPNGAGIPQRSLASSMLAQSLLAPVDEVLSNAKRNGEFEVYRWMDDIWIFADNLRHLKDLVSDIEEALAQVRLSLNSEKTKFGYAGEVTSILPLHESVSGVVQTKSLFSASAILDDWDESPLFAISIAMQKMLKAKNFNALNKLNSQNISHWSFAANRLVKAFRASGIWAQYVDWYRSYARQHLSGDDGSVAAWGQMFPNLYSEKLGVVREAFIDLLRSTRFHIAMPIAIQKLSSWKIDFPVDTEPSISNLFVARAWKFAGYHGKLETDEVTEKFFQFHGNSKIELVDRFAD